MHQKSLSKARSSQKLKSRVRSQMRSKSHLRQGDAGGDLTIDESADLELQELARREISASKVSMGGAAKAAEPGASVKNHVVEVSLVDVSGQENSNEEGRRALER